MRKFDHRASPEYRELVQRAPKPVKHAHVGANELRELLPVLEALPDLTFPINSAGELLDALGRDDTLSIVGVKVNPALLIKRMPAYYFPVASYDNLIEKMAELVRANRTRVDPALHAENLRRKLPKLSFPITSAKELAESVKGIDSFPLGDRRVDLKAAIGLLPKDFFPVRDQRDLERKTLRFVSSRPLIEPE